MIAHFCDCAAGVSSPPLGLDLSKNRYGFAFAELLGLGADFERVCITLWAGRQTSAVQIGEILESEQLTKEFLDLSSILTLVSLHT